MSNLKKNSILLIIFSFISRILGFLRDIILSYKFGATGITDVFLIVSNIPIAIFSGISTSLLTTYISTLHKIENEESEDYINKFNSNLINILLLITTFLVCILYFFSSSILKIFAFGLKGDVLLLAVKEYNIVIFSIIFIAISTVFQGFLQAKEDFRFTILSGPILNMIIISGVLLSSKSSPHIMAISVLLVYIIYLFLYSIPSFKNGFKYRINNLNFFDKNIIKIIKLMFPIFLGKVFLDINKVIDRSLASTLVVGSVSALSYADKLSGIVITTFPTSIALSIYPRFSKLCIEGKYDEMNNILENSLKIILIFIFPLTVCIMTITTPIVKLLFFRGSFSEIAVVMTSESILYYSIAAIPISLKMILEQYFYSKGDMSGPMRDSIISIFLNIVLNFIFVKIFGLKGIALATSISSIFMCILFFKRLKMLKINFNFRKFFKFFLMLFMISLIMALVVKLTYFAMEILFDSLFIDILISSLLGTIVFFVIFLLINPEYKKYFSNFKDVIKRKNI